MNEFPVNTGRLPETAGDIIGSGKTLMQVQTNYATAISVQRPRNLVDVQRRCMEEAKLAGDSFFYGWKIKSTDKRTGESIETPMTGPSIDLALCAVRNFGNSVVQQRPMQETQNAFIFTAAFIDLETGFTIERQFRMSKDFPVYGNMDKFRKEDVRFQIGQSKAIRNVVLNAVPSGLVDRMMEAAQDSVRSKVDSEIKAKGIKVVREAVAASFTKLKVDIKRICKYIGLEVEEWDAETITQLYGDLKALKAGRETVDTLYSAEEPEDNGPGLSTNGMKAGNPEDRQGYGDGSSALATKKAEEGDPNKGPELF